jgi:hypothetical protein
LNPQKGTAFKKRLEWAMLHKKQKSGTDGISPARISFGKPAIFDFGRFFGRFNGLFSA